MKYIDLKDLWLLKTEYLIALVKTKNLEDIANVWVAIQREYYNIKD